MTVQNTKISKRKENRLTSRGLFDGAFSAILKEERSYETLRQVRDLVVAIVGTLGWLAAGGINETKTYYKEIKEVNAMGQDALDKRIRVGGDVQKDSIVRDGQGSSLRSHAE